MLNIEWHELMLCCLVFYDLQFKRWNVVNASVNGENDIRLNDSHKVADLAELTQLPFFTTN